MITIKALRSRGGVISWTYDTPQQCAKFWKRLCETGRAPDTNESLVRAYYFGPNCKAGDGPNKAWGS